MAPIAQVNGDNIGYSIFRSRVRLLEAETIIQADLTTQEGFDWFKKNWQSDFVEYLTASKAYSEDSSLDKFRLIEQGAVITKGALYQWFEEIIEIE